MVDFHEDVCHEGQSPQQRYAVGMLRLRMQRREQQQLLVGQLRHMPLVIRSPYPECQRAFSLPQFHLLHPAAQQRRQIPVACRRDHFSYRTAAYQQGVQILFQKRVDAVLSPAHRHALQKVPQPRLHRAVPAVHLHAAAEADQLAHGGIHHRHRFPHRLIQPQFSAALGRKAPQSRKGMLLPAPELYRPDRRRSAFSPPKLQTIHSFSLESAFHSSHAHALFVHGPVHGLSRSHLSHHADGREPPALLPHQIHGKIPHLHRWANRLPATSCLPAGALPRHRLASSAPGGASALSLACRVLKSEHDHACRLTLVTANPPLRSPIRSIAKYRISSMA